IAVDIVIGAVLSAAPIYLFQPGFINCNLKWT
ncbi:uncharacterized protein METZ01_LOCUS495682, partial [marine metagenome]